MNLGYVDSELGLKPVPLFAKEEADARGAAVGKPTPVTYGGRPACSAGSSCSTGSSSQLLSRFIRGENNIHSLLNYLNLFMEIF